MKLLLIRRGRLRLSVFHAVGSVLRMPAVEAVLLWQFEGRFEVLLSKRPDDDPHFAGQWHSVGGIALLGDSSAGNAAIRIVHREVGWMPDPETFVYEKKRGPYFSRHERGAEAHTVIAVPLPGQGAFVAPEGYRFFPVDELPEPMMAHHRVIVGRAVDALRKSQATVE